MRAKKWLIIFLTFALIMPIFSGVAQAAVTTDQLQALFNRLDTRNSGNWYKDQNNENGVLAWDESYVMRSYLEMYEATKDTKYLDKFIIHADSVLKQRDSVRGVKDYRGLSLPAWSGGDRYTKDGTLKIFEVHTAMIALPYARFATIVKGNPSLSVYKNTAAVYLKASRDAVAVHDSQWIVSGSEMYMNRPYNMFVSLGQVFLEIYRASGETAYKDKAVKIATHFKNNLSLDTATNSYYWRYMRSGSYTGQEDLSHGAIDVDFANTAYECGVVFTAADMQRFGNAIQKKIIKSDGTIADKVNGTGTSPNQSFIGLWLPYYHWAPSLFDTSYKKVSAITAPQGEDLLSAAFLNKVNAIKNGGTAPVDPTPVDPVPADPTPVDAVPEIKTAAPSTALTVTKQASITAQVTDDKGVSKVTFLYASSSSGPWTEIGSTAMSGGTALSITCSMDWDLTKLADGTYYVQAQAVDSAGQTVQAVVGHFLKDALAPQVLSKTPAENAKVSAPGSVSLAFSESVTGVSASTVQVEGVSGQVTYDAAGKKAVFTPTAPLAAGTYKVVINSGIKDAAGNALTPLSWTFQVLPPATSNYLKNGDFTSGKTSWSGSGAVVKTESNGNIYGAASYGWTFFQDLQLTPAQYRLSALVKKGTGTTEARMVVMFIDSAGKRTVASDSLYKFVGTGWETMPEKVITVPKTAVTVRVYLLTNGGTGYHGFDNVKMEKI